jgi:hypothetical protein
MSETDITTKTKANKMAEVTIFNRNTDKPVTQWQKDLDEFLDKFKYTHCKVDEDGELIMFDINPYSIKEYLKGSQRRNAWAELQKRYDEGER